MNKIVKGLICAGLCCTLFAAGCKKSKLDSETRALRLAIGALDGNFNPFSYTALNDGEMVGMTQISMLTSDDKGNIVCGQDYATVALDYSKTYYDAKVGGSVVSEGTTDGRTEYEFVIKNGIKYSDGVDLTIKDVLFNLYVYLDPAYTGSMTIYSTDIQGLTAYRTQTPGEADDSSTNIDETFNADAKERIQKIVDWTQDGVNNTEPTDAAVKADYETAKRLFREELETDWTSVYSGWRESYKNLYNFNAAWQAYLLNEGIVFVQSSLTEGGTRKQMFNDLNGDGKKDDGELYYTSLDPIQSGASNVNGAVGEIHHQDIIDDIAAKTSAANVSAYMTAHNCDEETAKTALQREYCIEKVFDNYSGKDQIANVVQFWATATSLLEQFTGEARTEYYESKKQNGQLAVQTISGITATTVPGSTLSSGFHGEMHSAFTDESYSVLKIVINGIDPKAIYNFSFSVAPLHYYSSTNYNGVNYVEQANGIDKFGIDMGNDKFFTEVIKEPSKTGLPVGAGAYMGSKQSGGAASEKGQFFENDSIVYFERNPYFETVGTGINNAKIKNIRYKVTSDDMIMSALRTEEIDYGTPNATPTNQTAVTSVSHLSSVSYRTGGYGYVGINPKFVPEVNVRRAIMKAMDTRSIIRNYYGEDLAETIWRPMSTTSWVYDNAPLSQGVSEHSAVAYETNDEEIVKLVKAAGYELQNGVFTKVREVDGMTNAQIGTTLKITFTIAGESQDHPAFNMFRDTEKRLNAIGFDITVSTDSSALKNLARGDLAVWAAAWTSASDPDMFQIYHKDSKATSVNNWNYPNIMLDTVKWDYEYTIIDSLSTKIDQARQVDDQVRRSVTYAECLDLVMQLSVELPTYQRNDLCIYNVKVLDRNTMTKEPSYNMGLIGRIWELDYV